VVQVRRPHHLVPACKLKDTGHELQQGGFIVRDALREQKVSVGVDHDAVVVGFAGINAGPKLNQRTASSLLDG
jgi:hypothetical protein